MMSARRRDDWDDWDDEPAESPPSPGLLSTSRILVGLAVLVVLALVFGALVTRDSMEFGEVPPQLVGTWICDDEAHSDLWVEFEPGWMSVGTGGTGKTRNRVVGVDVERVGGLERVVVRYRDMAGRDHFAEIRLDAAKGELRFADQPQRSWSRYD